MFRIASDRDALLEEGCTPETKVLKQKQALELLRLRGYMIKDDPLEPSSA